MLGEENGIGKCLKVETSIARERSEYIEKGRRTRGKDKPRDLEKTC